MICDETELARALCESGLREEGRLVRELQGELASARQLGALLQFSSACEFDLVIPADPAAIRSVTEGVAEVLRSKVGVFGREFEIELALQEALANAVRHGCAGDATKFACCTVTYREAGEVRIVVRDPGRGFDLMDVPNPLDGTNPHTNYWLRSSDLCCDRVYGAGRPTYTPGGDHPCADSFWRRHSCWCCTPPRRRLRTAGRPCSSAKTGRKSPQSRQ